MDWNLQNRDTEWGEMALWLRVLTAHAEELCSGSSSHVAAHHHLEL